MVDKDPGHLVYVMWSKCVCVCVGRYGLLQAYRAKHRAAQRLMEYARHPFPLPAWQAVTTGTGPCLNVFP